MYCVRTGSLQRCVEKLACLIETAAEASLLWQRSVACKHCAVPPDDPLLVAPNAGSVSDRA
eukprot:2980696-Rhodomonas_salina.1